MENRDLQIKCKNYKHVISKRNCPHVAPGCSHSSCLPVLLPKDDRGCLQTTASVKRPTSNKDLPERPPGQLLWLVLWGCLGQRATCARRYLQRLLEWANWAQASPTRCFASAIQCQKRLVAKWENMKQAWAQELAQATPPYKVETSQRRPKSWVSEVLKWLKFRKS